MSKRQRQNVLKCEIDGQHVFEVGSELHEIKSSSISHVCVVISLGKVRILDFIKVFQ